MASAYTCMCSNKQSVVVERKGGIKEERDGRRIGVREGSSEGERKNREEIVLHNVVV